MKMTQNHAVSKNNKLVKALYRNLLRWCDDIEVQTNNDVEPIPLEPMPPPITLLPYSNVDVSLLADLAAYVEHKQKNSVQKFNKVQNQKFYDRRELLSHISSLLPPNSTVDPKRLTLHVTNLQNIRNAIQVGFKMSSSSTKDSGIWQEQINMGFDTLRNLKEHIQPILEERWKQRQYHLKRDGIHFCVGQVVKHKSQKWRGIIYGWKHFDDIVTNDVDFKLNKDQEQLSKDLGALYSILVDSTDLHRLQQEGNDSDNHASTDNHIQHIPQCDLEEVFEYRLTRIRNPLLSTKFERLDISHGCPSYSPKPSLAYEFPMDHHGLDNTPTENQYIDNLPENDLAAINCCKETIKGIQLLSFYVRNIVSTMAADEIATIIAPSSVTTNPILDSLGDQLDSILLECESCQSIDINSPSSISLLKSNSTKVIASVNTFIRQIFDTMAQRRLSLQHTSQIKYQLGSIVKEKTNGFRGVVVGYTFPLSSNMKSKNSNDKTRGSLFYHLKPDINDVNANFRTGENNMNPFGLDRLFYANEHQLTACTLEESKNGLDVDLDDTGWTFEKGTNECIYIPPDEIKFQYGRRLQHEDMISMLMMSLVSEILKIQYSIQIGTVYASNDTSQLREIVSKLSLDNLFLLLRNSDSADSSKILEEFVHEIFNAHPDVSAREIFADGARYLMHGEPNGALEIFHSLLVDHPTYFECWNKIATSHFLNGSMDDSLYATEQALSFEARHYSAMAGLGLIRQTEGDVKGAVKAFSDCLDYSPWSMVSSTLSSCLDQMESKKSSREMPTGPSIDNQERK